MEERWHPIIGFRSYSISDRGQVHSERHGGVLSLTQNAHGVVKVNLFRDKKMYTKSVRLLVAQAFLDDPNPECDTPINLDGDPTNNNYFNLAWRPRWFAWKYARQFHQEIPVFYHSNVRNLHTDITYPSVMEAGINDGIIWEYLWESVLSSRPVYPTGCVYALA